MPRTPQHKLTRMLARRSRLLGGPPQTPDGSARTWTKWVSPGSVRVHRTVPVRTGRRPRLTAQWPPVSKEKNMVERISDTAAVQQAQQDAIDDLTRAFGALADRVETLEGAASVDASDAPMRQRPEQGR